MAWHPPQHGEAFARWREERAASAGPFAGEDLARLAWDAAVREAGALLNGNEERPAREKLAELGGDALGRWWTEKGRDFTGDSAAVLAMRAWDAAIRAGVLLLHDEKDRLVRGGDYEPAAVMRDCAEGVGRLFASPYKWNPEQSSIEWSIEARARFLRRLPNERLEDLRRSDGPDDPAAAALLSVLRERGME